ncbi:unnamed protein product [Staurois parvus]|uniref:Uncharacterized protein n=1 Tax=Staurois parvus TaxID=386267 RepID=A0ABN9CCQ5_9NEOB|nr:unnamed protein product [Staurois parvus]
MGGIVPHHWYQWENSAPSLVSCQWKRNSAPSLVSVGGIEPHSWCQWGRIVPHHRFSGGRNSAPS